MSLSKVYRTETKWDIGVKISITPAVNESNHPEQKYTQISPNLPYVYLMLSQRKQNEGRLYFWNYSI